MWLQRIVHLEDYRDRAAFDEPTLRWSAPLYSDCHHRGSCFRPSTCPQTRTTAPSARCASRLRTVLSVTVAQLCALWPVTPTQNILAIQMQLGIAVPLIPISVTSFLVSLSFPYKAYCSLSDGGFSQAVCCRRPCNALAPNALYADNKVGCAKCLAE